MRKREHLAAITFSARDTECRRRADDRAHFLDATVCSEFANFCAEYLLISSALMFAMPSPLFSSLF